VIRLCVIAAMAALLLPASASAQQIFGDGGEIPVRATGSLVVDWESDPATCAGVGRCGLDGVTTWRLPARGSLFIARRAGILSLGDFFSLARGGAASRVRRGDHLCADAVPVGSYAVVEAEGGRFAFPFADLLSGVFTGRCAGPALEDVAGALPTVAVPVARARRGRMTLGFDGSGTFAAHGLRGTVTSNAGLRLGKPSPPGPESSPPRVRTERIRYVSSRFRVAEIRGEVGFDVRGAAGCEPLDACGLAGTLRIVPRATAGSLELFSRGPARLGRRGALASVGLRGGGADPRFTVFGGGSWAGAGLAVASIGRPEDAVPCRDSVLLRNGVLLMTVEGDRVRAQLFAGFAGFSAGGASGRTRCPGPVVGGSFPIAEAELPLRALGARRVEIALTAPVPLADDGWSIAARPEVTVVLERRAPREEVRREPRF
jgi:hypothetical protein